MQHEETQGTLDNTGRTKQAAMSEVMLSLSRKYDQRRLMWIPEHSCPPPPYPTRDLHSYTTALSLHLSCCPAALLPCHAF
ncbi:hypothetical protein E2C01_030770 [Portunus trituberculatus]|uniref:Uncharacterized protein n=1 Tax=Portunus trituberculatus TaxID=210409 RepID=A0A5B7EVS9_PORTR|nr:hypothetical protein [Portunus trituberculatus]